MAFETMGLCIPLKNASKHAVPIWMHFVTIVYYRPILSYSVYITGKGVDIIELIRNFVSEGACAFSMTKISFLGNMRRIRYYMHATPSPSICMAPQLCRLKSPLILAMVWAVFVHPSYSNQILEEFEVAADVIVHMKLGMI